MKKLLTTLFFLLFATMTIQAQEKLFSLEDLNYGGKNYRAMSPKNRYYVWWGDQLVRNDMEACYAVDSKGNESTLFTLARIQTLAQSNSSNKMRHLLNASFPYADKSIVEVYNGHERMLIDWKKGALVAKYDRTDTQAEALSHASKNYAFIRGDQLFVSDEKGNERQLTTDGSREIVYGQAVHRNEFGIEEGLFWSPDGNKLAFYRMDQSMVEDYPQVNIFAREAVLEPDKYPMAGETSHEVTVGVYDVATKQIVYLQAGNPKDRYFTNIAWSPDSKTVYMFELNRDQNDCALISYDAATGNKKQTLYRETDSKYVEPQNPIIFLPWDADKFLLQSQKDGYKHLYLFNAQGKELKQVTSGKWVVIDVLGFNKKRHEIIIVSNEKHALQKNIYAVNIDNGKRRLLDNGKGYHTPTLSASGNAVIDKWQEPTVPRNIALIETASAKSNLLFSAENPWQGYKIPTYETGTLKAADGVTDLYYRMVKPADFDPTQQYPTIVYVYGGPHAHNVDARWHWGSRSWETYMAQKGYILFIMDNRGSENRGKEFEQATFRQLGQIEMADQMKGIEFLQSLSYVDTARIGVHGWSFGGFMTISLMTNHPDVFKVGVAGGPVIDWKWYEVMYGERYMDTPQDNPEGYERTSLINQAKNLKGKLQIIIGTNDRTVVPQHAESFIAECIKVGTQPDYFIYPGEPHNMRGHQSTHLHERITQYFEDYLK